MTPDVMFFYSFCESFDFRYDTETRMRFLTQGIRLVIRSEIFYSKYNIFDLFYEVYDARCYVFFSFCDIFDFRYDTVTRMRFLTQGIKLVIRSEIFYSKYNVFDLFCEVYDARCYVFLFVL
jgi:hypothetical protein